MKTIDDINDFNYFAGNLRETNFKIIEDYIKNNNVKNILETGTIRGHPNEFSYIAGDGLSTLTFAHFAKKYNFNFYSIDISAYNIEQSKQVLKQFNLDNYVNYINLDSVLFLENFSEEIDIVYLDSYDFVEGEELNSQIHQLKEISSCHNKLKTNSLVFLDDCDQRMEGKCKLSTEFLLNNNYSLTVKNYQRIFKKV